eukprot:34784-Pyramimonas_sp.AAC.1
MDLRVDRPRLGPGGKLNGHGTSWARQFQGDLEIFSKIQPETRLAQARNSRKGLLDVCKNECFRTAVCMKWPQHIRHLFGGRYEEDERREARGGIGHVEQEEDMHEYVCTREKPKGDVCGSVFSTMWALAARVNKTRKMRGLYSMITSTNACPWCRR